MISTATAIHKKRLVYWIAKKVASPFWNCIVWIEICKRFCRREWIAWKIICNLFKLSSPSRSLCPWKEHFSALLYWLWVNSDLICLFTAGYLAQCHYNWCDDAIHLYDVYTTVSMTNRIFINRIFQRNCSKHIGNVNQIECSIIYILLSFDNLILFQIENQSRFWEKRLFLNFFHFVLRMRIMHAWLYFCDACLSVSINLFISVIHKIYALSMIYELDLNSTRYNYDVPKYSSFKMEISLFEPIKVTIRNTMCFFSISLSKFYYLILGKMEINRLWIYRDSDPFEWWPLSAETNKWDAKHNEGNLSKIRFFMRYLIWLRFANDLQRLIAWFASTFKQ